MNINKINLKKSISLLFLFHTLIVSSLAFAQELELSGKTTEDPTGTTTQTIEADAGEVTSVTVKDNSKMRNLKLDPLKNGVQLPPLEVDYNLESNSNKLMLNSFAFGENSFELVMDKFQNLEPALSKTLGFEKRNVLLISFASVLVRYGKIEAIGKGGESLWNFELNADDLLNWQEKLNEFKYLDKSDTSKVNFNSFFWKSKFGVLDFNLDRDAGKLKGKNFRFCISDYEGKLFSRICSVNYILKKEANDHWSLAKDIKKQEVRVLVKNEKAKPIDIVPVTIDKPFQFYAGLENGMSIEFFAKPQPLNLVDFWREPKNKNYIFMGHTNVPLKNFTEILSFDPKSFLAKVGWLPTIGDTKKYWTLEVDPSDPSIVYRGVGGGIFKQRFEISKAPPEFKVNLDKNTIESTYSDAPVIRAKGPANSQVKSIENKAESKGTRGDFLWTIKANQKGKSQARTLTVIADNTEWNYSYSIFRAPANELSFRLTGAVGGNSKSVLMGEFAFNKWFESLFSKGSNYYDKQRWGASFKYFQSLGSSSSTSSTGEVSDTSQKIITLDLKYRLTPGVWTLDESWGLMMGYEDLSLGVAKSPLVGGGFFWARSMPKIFDSIFNIVPVMRYPKWVDMEIVFYPVGLKSSVAAGQNYSVNFHGKVLWTQSVFGEAGFGMKSFDLKDKIEGKKTALQSFYGTVGLGINF
jgi:hypothetical protein